MAAGFCFHGRQSIGNCARDAFVSLSFSLFSPFSDLVSVNKQCFHCSPLSKGEWLPARSPLLPFGPVFSKLQSSGSVKVLPFKLDWLISGEKGCGWALPAEGRVSWSVEHLLGDGGISAEGWHGDRYSVLELWGQVELRRLQSFMPVGLQ